MGCGGNDAPMPSKVPVRENQKSTATKLPAPTNDASVPTQKSNTTNSKPVSNAVPVQPTPSKPESIKTTATPQQVYLPRDDRPKHNDSELATVGINVFESKHIKLYSDIDSEIAAGLPPIVDALFVDLENYFGKLPPTRSGAPYQMTGYLMADKARYADLGLLPKQDLGSFHGRQIGRRFWMHDQTSSYYRKHLMLHEATHCYMQAIPGVVAPYWYLEGMAELCGTHREKADGGFEFRVFPDDSKSFPGHGRIRLAQREMKKNGFARLQSITDFTANQFAKRNECYAWAWVLCSFLDKHNTYRERFRELGQYTTSARFNQSFRESFNADYQNLLAEWTVFASGIDDNFDFRRAAMSLKSGQPLTTETHVCEVKADQGWQSTSIRIQKNTPYRIQATGQFTVAQEPKPWISEADGISIQYFDSRPLGQLLGVVYNAETTKADAFAKPIPIGSDRILTPEHDGTLYLRINDRWSQLRDNTGKLKIAISKVH